MNKLTRFFLFLSIVLLNGCKKEHNTEEEFDNTIFVGEWCYNSGDYYTDITFDPLRFTGIIYEGNPLTESDKISGAWGYIVASGILSMDIYHYSTGESTDANYSVLKIDSYAMQLRNHNLNSVENYSKVIETLNLKQGKEEYINYTRNIPLNVSSYTSSHPSIAKVDNNGLISAINKGISYISIATDVGILIVKVEVS